MIMVAAALLTENFSPSDGEIVHALRDNLYRRGAYLHIVAAVGATAAWRVRAQPRGRASA